MANKNNKLIPLTHLRELKGLSQKELANEVKLSAGAIGLYETGKRKPTLNNGLKIATYFGVPVDRIQFDCRKAR